MYSGTECLNKISINTGKINFYFDDTGYLKVEIDGREYDYKWGAHGKNFKAFLKGLDSQYTANKLFPREYMWSFDKKKTFSSLRKAIAEEYPWYVRMEEQKELRKALNHIYSNISTENGFVDMMQDKWRSDLLNEFNSEPWHFIERKESDFYKLFCAEFKKFKDQL